MTSPLVKWVGGKTKLLPELVKRMPPKYRTYYEPFFGGGALFFHLEPKRAVISDWNSSLMMTYETVQMQPDSVIRSLSQMARYHSRDYYEAQRDRWNFPYLAGKRDGKKQRVYFSALFLYLNRTCFNGLWRVNSKGEFNVPMGDYPLQLLTGAGICDPERIRAASAALERATIRSGDYWKNCSGAKRGDFVYLDPPYDPVSETASFTSYTAGGFGTEAQHMLATRAKQLVDAGAQVMLSNADTKFIRAIYKDLGFTLHKVSAPRAINSNGKKRGKVAELIITGGY